MTGIRPFSSGDLPAVLKLMDARLPRWNRGGSIGGSFLTETLLEHPWADAELPSLVAVDLKGEVVGFVGVQVRRLRFGDRSLRGVCCSHLVVADDPRAGVWGALLLREVFAGNPDLAWTDSANDVVVRLWRAQGGHLDYSRCSDWMLVLKPLRWIGGAIRAGIRRGSARGDVAPVGVVPVRAVRSRLASGAPVSSRSRVSGSRATAEEIVAALPAIARDTCLRVDYDQPFLQLLLAQVQRVEGHVEHRLVHRDGASIGWYVYLSRPGGAARVLHLCAPEAEMDAVVGELVDHAAATGSVAVSGRFEPHLYWPLRARHAALGFARQPLVKSRDLEVRAALASGSSLLTLLDGEWFVT